MGALGMTSDAVGRLASGEIPAIVLRGALAPSACHEIIRRLLHNGHIAPEMRPYVHNRLPRRQTAAAKKEAWKTAIETGRVGVSLANRAGSLDLLETPQQARSRYFQETAHAHRDFDELCSGLARAADPVAVVYDALAALSGGTKSSCTAAERPASVGETLHYGPAVIRLNPPTVAGDIWNNASRRDRPHTDSVKLKDKRPLEDFSVARFDTQLAAILVLQEPHRLAQTGAPTGEVYHDSILYACSLQQARSRGLTSQVFQPGRGLVDDVDPELLAKAVESGAVPQPTPIDLGEGDLYFFKADSVHQVPWFEGDRARVVLGAFVGYSEAEPTIEVWA
jgi:hypothetical protein